MTHWAKASTPAPPGLAPREIVAASWLQRGRPGLKLQRPAQPGR